MVPVPPVISTLLLCRSAGRLLAEEDLSEGLVEGASGGVGCESEESGKDPHLSVLPHQEILADRGSVPAGRH